jgi:hypothetical protein
MLLVRYVQYPCKLAETTPAPVASYFRNQRTKSHAKHEHNCPRAWQSYCFATSGTRWADTFISGRGVRPASGVVSCISLNRISLRPPCESFEWGRPRGELGKGSKDMYLISMERQCTHVGDKRDRRKTMHAMRCADACGRSGGWRGWRWRWC